MEPMDRKMTRTIERWAQDNDGRPLLIRGARRVGKTTVVELAARRLFPSYVKLDFQTDLTALEQVFSGPTDDLNRIIGNISEYKGVNLSPEGTLLFFDEIQLCEKALNSLRFFSGSKWRVIATGSLFGVTVRRRQLPFPSGVKQVRMYPMDFEEFLWALNEKPMADAIRNHCVTGEPYILHEHAMDYYHKYLVVGGMPRVVEEYRGTRQLDRVAEQQDEIDATYVSDMTDPDNGINGVGAKRIWESLPKQLLRSSTKKFKYNKVMRGGRRSNLLEPLDWLEAAGIVTQNDMTKDTIAPLSPYEEEEGSFFKVYMADTGLMFRKFGLDAPVFLNPQTRELLSSDFRGALAENATMQALQANGLKTFYWTPRGKEKGELDFIVQNGRGQITPIEVKSGRNVSAKTLRKFVSEGQSPRAIRLSELQFGTSEIGDSGCTLHDIPLYAAFAIADTLV